MAELPREIEIKRTEAGKPVLGGALAGALSVSLSHDARYCLGIAGDGPQGCDVQSIDHRSAEDWHALLGAGHRAILDELGNRENLDLAGTRIWAAMECVYKSLGVRDVELAVDAIDDRAILFRTKVKDGAGPHVLTVPMTFTLGPERIVALTVVRTPAPDKLPPEQNDAADELARAGYDAGALQIAGDPGSRELIMRWPVTFKDAASPDRGLHLNAVAEWTGKAREIAMLPIAGAIGRDLGSGRYAMVTNKTSIDMLGRARAGDIVELRYAAERARDLPGSAIELSFRLSAGGRPIARAAMRTTWVTVEGHGIVRPAPAPAYLLDFLDARAPRDRAPETAMPEPDGRSIWRKPHGPTRGPLLLERSFETSMVDANLVGNIYFAQYFAWQSRLADAYLYPILTAAYRSGTGVPVVRRAEIEHLQDAMPFETIVVVMTLEALRGDHVTLGFDYFRAADNTHRTKLAFGTQELAAASGELPRELLAALEARVRSEDRT